MKTTNTLVCILGAVLLCGCGQKQAARVARLESDLAALQARAAAQDRLLSQFTNTYAEHLAGAVAFQKRQDEFMTNALDIMHSEQALAQAMLDAYNSITNQPKPVRYVVTAPIRKPEMFQGIPLDVWGSITKNAKQKWGEDYEMVLFEVQKQAAAYRKLHPQ
jgi:hypothetical protein